MRRHGLLRRGGRAEPNPVIVSRGGSPRTPLPRFSGLLAMVPLARAMAAPAAARDKTPNPPKISEAAIAEVQRAIDEQRYVDAGRMLDKAALAGAADPRLTILG